MIERHLDIPTADGAMNSFVVHPDEGGPHPVVLFYMDAPGKREELHDMARRLAAVGYFVVLPNLYYRRTRDWYLTERSEEKLQHMFGLMATLDRATTECDTQALLAFVDAQPQADAGRIGAVGYCMSGPFVIWAAAAHPERLCCIAVIHGANMATDRADSPHRVAARLRCETYVACAEVDRWAPPADIAQLQAGLQASGAPHRVEWYPKLEHGFVFPQRGCYDKAGAERHWERLFGLFGRRLVRPDGHAGGRPQPPALPQRRPRIPYRSDVEAGHSRVVDAIRQRRGGQLFNLDRILLHSPPVAEGWNLFFTRLRGDQLVLPALPRELAMCAVAMLNGAEYELHHHAPLFLAAGGTPAQVDELRRLGADPDAALASPLWNEAQRALLRVVVQSTRQVTVDDTAFDAARRALDSDRALFELLAVTAAYNMVSRLLVAFGVEPE